MAGLLTRTGPFIFPNGRQASQWALSAENEGNASWPGATAIVHLTYRIAFAQIVNRRKRQRR